jgi:hypothetical protein
MSDLRGLHQPTADLTRCRLCVAPVPPGGWVGLCPMNLDARRNGCQATQEQLVAVRANGRPLYPSVLDNESACPICSPAGQAGPIIREWVIIRVSRLVLKLQEQVREQAFTIHELTHAKVYGSSPLFVFSARCPGQRQRRLLILPFCNRCSSNCSRPNKCSSNCSRRSRRCCGGPLRPYRVQHHLPRAGAALRNPPFSSPQETVLSMDEFFRGLPPHALAWEIPDRRPRTHAKPQLLQKFIPHVSAALLTAQIDGLRLQPNHRHQIVDTSERKFSGLSMGCAPAIGVWPDGYDINDLSTVQVWGDCQSTLDLTSHSTKSRSSNYCRVSTTARKSRSAFYTPMTDCLSSPPVVLTLFVVSFTVRLLSSFPLQETLMAQPGRPAFTMFITDWHSVWFMRVRRANGGFSLAETTRPIAIEGDGSRALLHLLTESPDVWLLPLGLRNIRVQYPNGCVHSHAHAIAYHSAVLRVNAPEDGMPRVIKTSNDEHFLNNEQHALAQVHGAAPVDGIIQLLDASESALLFPLLAGSMDRARELGIAVTFQMLAALVPALRTMHERNVFHRDIRPPNILIQVPQVVKFVEPSNGDDPCLVLADFGFATLRAVPAAFAGAPRLFWSPLMLRVLAPAPNEPYAYTATDDLHMFVRTVFMIAHMYAEPAPVAAAAAQAAENAPLVRIQLPSDGSPGDIEEFWNVQLAGPLWSALELAARNGNYDALAAAIGALPPAWLPAPPRSHPPPPTAGLAAVSSTQGVHVHLRPALRVRTRPASLVSDATLPPRRVPKLK